MFISIAGITVLYLLMNISVASVLPFETVKNSSFVVSDFIKELAGSAAANIITILILWVAFASIFSATLGYSRIPYAAAKDGAFFPLFAKLHPKKGFPYISLLFLGSVAFVFSLLFDNLRDVIKAILAMRILVQFISQAVGLLLLHKRRGQRFFPWRMPLFPVPVILAILIWLFIFQSTGILMLYGLGVAMLGIIAFLVKSYLLKEWPFADVRNEKDVNLLFTDNPEINSQQQKDDL